MDFDRGFPGHDYPVCRDFLAYGMGIVTVADARNLLGPKTVLTCAPEVGPDELEGMRQFTFETFAPQAVELPQVNGHTVLQYIRDLIQALKDQGIAQQEALDRMRRALPEDWAQPSTCPPRSREGV